MLSIERLLKVTNCDKVCLRVSLASQGCCVTVDGEESFVILTIENVHEHDGRFYGVACHQDSYDSFYYNEDSGQWKSIDRLVEDA